jgi:hypothetical protein
MSEDDQKVVEVQFNKRLITQQNAVLEEDNSDYLAFKAVDRKQRRLLIKTVGTPSEWVTYQYLLRIVIDPTATQIVLIFSFMGITITGRNLWLMADAIAEDRCDYIQQFDPQKWEKPTDAAAAYVESIAFVTDRAPGENARGGK